MRQAIKDIGYEQKGFHWAKAKFACHLHPQSEHIAQGVDATAKKEEGAGDQGIMFGYACDETPELMPATLQYSHNILPASGRGLRHSGECPVRGRPGRQRARSPCAMKTTARSRCCRSSSRTSSTKKRLGLHIATPKRIEGVIRPYVESVFPAGPDHQEDQVARQPDVGRFEIEKGEAGRLTQTRLAARSSSTPTGGAAPHGGSAQLSAQGPDQGRPLGGLPLPLPGQERGGLGPRQEVHHPDQLRDRRGPAAQLLCRSAQHRRDRSGRSWS